MPAKERFQFDVRPMDIVLVALKLSEKPTDLPNFRRAVELLAMATTLVPEVKRLAQQHRQLSVPKAKMRTYSVSETARLVKKSERTVRYYCRRLNIPPRGINEGNLRYIKELSEHPRSKPDEQILRAIGRESQRARIRGRLAPRRE
jgi:hypothetical protein